jgi:hypothetical protein
MEGFALARWQVVVFKVWFASNSYSSAASLPHISVRRKTQSQRASLPVPIRTYATSLTQ